VGTTLSLQDAIIWTETLKPYNHLENLRTQWITATDAATKREAAQLGQAAPEACHGRNGQLIIQRDRQGKMESGFSATRRRLAPRHADSLVLAEIGRRSREGGDGHTARGQRRTSANPTHVSAASESLRKAITASHAS